MASPMSAQFDDSEESKQEYLNFITSIACECLWGGNGHKAVIVHCDPVNKSLAVYSLNADNDEAQTMVHAISHHYSLPRPEVMQ
jgi:hypothetical protein